MILKLYSNSSDNNDINKNLTLIDEVNVTIQEDCSMEAPTFVLNYATNLKGVNYVYSEDFGRFYFVRSRTFRNGGRIDFDCVVDVLSTFKNEVKNLEAVIDRQEFLFNAYMTDSEYICDNKSTIETKNFPFGFSDNLSIYLTIRGN